MTSTHDVGQTLQEPSSASKTGEVRQHFNFESRRGDIILVSFPKCGTHWFQQVIQLILSGGQSAPDYFEYMRRTPIIERTGSETLEGLPFPRFLRTHLPMSKIRLSDEAKHVYVARNPWDCFIYYLYHTKNWPGSKNQDVTSEDFFNLFVNGKTEYGDFFDHLLPWYDRKDDANVLFLTYEQMKEDPRPVCFEAGGLSGRALRTAATGGRFNP